MEWNVLISAFIAAKFYNYQFHFSQTLLSLIFDTQLHNLFYEFVSTVTEDQSAMGYRIASSYSRWTTIVWTWFNKNLTMVNVIQRQWTENVSPANICLFKVNNRNTRIKTFLQLQRDSNADVILVFLLLSLNIFHTFLFCFYCWR